MMPDINGAARVWSEYQEAVFSAAVDGVSAVVVAGPGCAKTSTALEAARRMGGRGRALYLAFNKSVASEVKARGLRGVDSLTLHSLGYRQILADARTRGMEPPEVRGDKVVSMLLEDPSTLAGITPRSSTPRKTAAGLARIVSLLKASGAREVDGDAALAAVRASDIMLESSGVPGTDAGADAAGARSAAEQAADIVCSTMAWCLDTAEESIDFDDQIWLPGAWDLPPLSGRWDLAVVDELQDLTPAQSMLASRSAGLASTLAIGDPRQGIYSFRGAHGGAFDEFASERDLLLPLTYRCCRAVVDLAGRMAPELVAFRDVEGAVHRMPNGDPALLGCSPGDLVVSRTNAECARACVFLLRHGIPSTIIGRDFEVLLEAMVARLAGDRIGTLRSDELASMAAAWATEAEERMADMPQLARAEVDRALAVEALARSRGQASIPELLVFIRSMFSDDGSSRARVRLSTIHRAKGLEAPRVVVMGHDKLESGMRSGGEAANLWFVAVTRAFDELALVAEDYAG
jgi:superfamily I DNA/RNA helicase